MSNAPPSFLTGPGFSAYAEFTGFQDRWPVETAWLYAKLVRVRSYGMAEETAAPFSPPDLYSAQFHNAGVFYVAYATEDDAGDPEPDKAEVYVVMCADFAGLPNLSALEAEIRRRRIHAGA